MRQLNFIKKNKLEWREVSEPKINGNNQAIVRPLVVSRCDLDLPIFRGETLFRPPFPVGHEFLGEIIDISEDVSDSFSIGEKVAIAFQISCGTCPHCLGHKSNNCTTVPPGSNYGMGKGGKDFGGGISDLVFVPYAKEMLLRIPTGIDLVSIASLSDNIVEAWKLVGQFLEKDPEESVLVIGGVAGSIGLYTVLLARAMGKSEVLYIDSSVERLKMVESWGIPVEEVTSFPRAHRNKFQIIADANGTKEGWNFGLRSASVDGKFGSASIFFTQELPIPYLDLYNTGIQINIGRVHSKEWMPKILNLIEKKLYDPSPVVTKKVDWEEAETALLEDAVKMVVVPK